MTPVDAICVTVKLFINNMIKLYVLMPGKKTINFYILLLFNLASNDNFCQQSSCFPIYMTLSAF